MALGMRFAAGGHHLSLQTFVDSKRDTMLTDAVADLTIHTIG
jgi:hypothetical protein